MSIRIAVAAAAKGSVALLVIGLLISVPLVVYGATLLITSPVQRDWPLKVAPPPNWTSHARSLSVCSELQYQSFKGSRPGNASGLIDGEQAFETSVSSSSRVGRRQPRPACRFASFQLKP